MKDLFFVNSSKSWGGGEKWHFSAARALSEDFRVSVVGAPDSALVQRASNVGMQVCSIGISNLSFLNPLKLFRLYRLFKAAHEPTVILNLPSDVKLAGVAARLAGVKKIVYRRGMPKAIKNTWMNRYLFQNVVTDVIVNSEEIGRSLTKNNEALVSPDKVHLIYNGVDPSNYVNFNGAGACQKQAGMLTIGTVGRMVEQKNQLQLLEVISRLKRQGHSVRLLIAGDGPLKGQMEARISGEGLESDVTLLGFLEDSRELLSCIDVFVFPSHYEGSANAIVEAMAMQLPVVAYDVSSMPEMVLDGETGFLAKYDDPEDFAEKTSRLLSDKDLGERMGAAGLERVKQIFSNNKNVEALKRVLT
jgi:glycosyltransferase involved in cell wall biosynthesis